MEKDRFTKESYADLIADKFDFAKKEFGMVRGAVRTSGGADMRDATLAVRYSRDGFRFDVAWSAFELAFSILMRFEKLDLPRSQRLIFFEPFIEFLTDGREEAIVPFVSPKMSLKELKSVATRREVVFENGLAPVAGAIAEKMREHFSDIKSPAEEDIRGYHKWMQAGRQK